MLKLVGLAGQAGSGKDTVGQFIVDTYGGQCLGQADPMKRYVKNLFGFSEDQLWGPSSLRNAPDPRFSKIDMFDMTDALDILDNRFDSYTQEWVENILAHQPAATHEPAFRGLRSWFAGLLQRISHQYGMNPRYALQTLGTEAGRDLMGQGVWREYALRTAFTLMGGGYTYNRLVGLRSPQKSYPAPFKGFAIITDLRFRDEILGVTGAGGAAIRIIRPDKSLTAAAEAGGITGHVSERELNEIPDSLFTKVIVNDGTLDELFVKVRAAVDEIYGVSK